ncbi:MOSC domain-containing protein [Amycolatopsis sp. NPDC004368]
MTTLELAGVFVGRPAVLGHRRDQPVLSAIVKGRAAAPELELTPLNLDGDEQADLSVHGGVDKAVCVASADHYPAWVEEGLDIGPGAFGENIAVSGADEATVRIGDVWEWGDVRLEVSQPRSPCFKIAMRTGRKDIVAVIVDSARCGWYLRVLRPGRVPTSGAVKVVRSDPAAPTIEELHNLAYANFAQLEPAVADKAVQRVEQVLELPALSPSYARGLRSSVERRRLRRAG